MKRRGNGNGFAVGAGAGGGGGERERASLSQWLCRALPLSLKGRDFEIGVPLSPAAGNPVKW